jgi:hypothetical protein
MAAGAAAEIQNRAMPRQRQLPLEERHFARRLFCGNRVQERAEPDGRISFVLRLSRNVHPHDHPAFDL